MTRRDVMMMLPALAAAQAAHAEQAATVPQAPAQGPQTAPLRHFRKRAPTPRKPARSALACVAAIGRDLALDVDGEVYPCALLIRSCQTVERPALARRLAAMSLGPVTDPQGLLQRRVQLRDAARAAGIFGAQSRKQSGLERCPACRYAAACFVCPIACAKNPDSADANRVPDFQCAFNRIALEYRRRFPRQP